MRAADACVHAPDARAHVQGSLCGGGGAAAAAVRLGLVAAPPQEGCAEGAPAEDVETCAPLLADKHALKARARASTHTHTRTHT
jgi:hypothetical protein